MLGPIRSAKDMTSGFPSFIATYVRYVFAFALGIGTWAVDLTVETEASKPLLDLTR